MPVTVLSSPSLPRHLRADRSDPNEGSRAGIPSGANVISRAAPIAVQHEQPSGNFEDILQPVTVPMPSAQFVQAVDIDASRLPPDAGNALVTPDFQSIENGIGAVSAPRAASVVSPTSPIPTSVEPQLPPQPMTQPVQQSAQPTTSVQFPQMQKKVRVRMSNRGMGKVTVSVRAVSVSETCVILAYPKEADNIIEPPICGSDNPIRVDFGSNTYTCVFGGWTADLEGMFLVILIRAEDEKKP